MNNTVGNIFDLIRSFPVQHPEAFSASLTFATVCIAKMFFVFDYSHIFREYQRKTVYFKSSLCFRLHHKNKKMSSGNIQYITYKNLGLNEIFNKIILNVYIIESGEVVSYIVSHVLKH